MARIMPFVQIRAPADKVQNFAGLRVEKQRVDREIAALGVVPRGFVSKRTSPGRRPS